MDSKEGISNISLAEVLLYLGPGAVFLMGLRIWGSFSPEWLFGATLAHNQAVIVFSFAIVAYSCGLFINEWCKLGAMKYMRLRFAPRIAGRFSSTERAITVLCHWLPIPAFDESMIEAQLDMNDAIKMLANLKDAAHLESPWDRLENFRLVIHAESEEQGSAMLRKAEREHQHLLFLLGLSLAVTLLAVQALFRTVVELTLGVRVHAANYIVIMATAAVVSIVLRLVAARVWAAELRLTCQVARMRAVTRRPGYTIVE
jgi:hypothetical protein